MSRAPPPPIRATEGTVLSRIPPRVAVRKNAPIELPHVMLLVDDPERTVIEPLAGQTAQHGAAVRLRPDGAGRPPPGLGADGGAAGRRWPAPCPPWPTPPAFNARYGTEDEPVLLFAVGDGNHSLATAKECYERQKRLTPPEQWDTLPARYALVELVNLHDDSLEFEPIHRVVFGAEPEELLAALTHGLPGRPAGAQGSRPCAPPTSTGNARGAITVPDPAAQLPVGTLQTFLDRVPGRAARRRRGLHPRGGRGPESWPRRPETIGFLLPAHGQGGALPHRHPRRGAAPQDLLHGGGPRQALLFGGPEDPGLMNPSGG